jgi:hypothetical protein
VTSPSAPGAPGEPRGDAGAVGGALVVGTEVAASALPGHRSDQGEFRDQGDNVRN